ncbi:hypothetical protein [Winogradskyella vidalii]|uniref:hypothetical protein n=1 Tax=Winogradskyella vidalii TaxID=2615024 RepID=UPI0015CD57B9|nr:hypothetical protein [Winogradskyella vidalii]
MKLKSLLLLPLMFLSISTFSQGDKSIPQDDTNIIIDYPDNVKAPLTKNEKALIDEVYQSKAQTLVYDDAKYLKDVKHLLRNRITIYEDGNPKTQKKGMMLSDIPLFDSYNKDLKRDENFNVENFNPLKYQLDFFAKGTYVYRVDNTNYFIQVTSQYRKIKK